MKSASRWAAGAWSLSMLAFGAPVEARGEDTTVDVEVKGEMLRRADDDTTSASTVLDDRELTAPGVSLAEVLGRAPGITLARTGGADDLATASLRGTTSAETSVYLGPLRLNDEFTGTADLSLLPTALFRQVKVYRGHAPIAFDRPGLGGAIVLEPFVPVGSSVLGATTMGSFGEQETTASGAVGDRTASAGIALRVRQIRGDYEYVDDRGTRFDAADDRVVRRRNADARTIDGWAGTRLAIGRRGSLTTTLHATSREQGVPGLGVVPADHARSRTTRALALTNATIACGSLATDPCSVNVFAFARGGTLTVSDPARELPFPTPQLVVTGTTTGAGAQVSDRAWSWLELEAGARSTLEGLSIAPKGAPSSHARRTASRFFGSAVARPGEITELRLEAALESDQTEGPGRDAREGFASGRFGASVRPAPELGFFGTVARYVRVPTLAEQYGASASILGNPELVRESGASADIGARGEISVGDALVLGSELVGFGRLASDLIAYRRSAAGVLRPYNVGSARVLGLEAVVSARILGVLWVDGSLSALDPRDTSDDRTLTNDVVPLLARLTATPTIAVELEDVVREIGWDHARFGAGLVYRSARIADSAGLIVLPSQVTLDLDMAVGFFRRALTIRARLTNLIDDRSTDLVGYPLPGRAIHIGLEARWP